ncbi:hypothetical protein Ciccas_010507, partial [Cichlidogyrus casuarinus]
LNLIGTPVSCICNPDSIEYREQFPIFYGLPSNYSSSGVFSPATTTSLDKKTVNNCDQSCVLDSVFSLNLETNLDGVSVDSGLSSSVDLSSACNKVPWASTANGPRSSSRSSLDSNIQPSPSSTITPWCSQLYRISSDCTDTCKKQPPGKQSHKHTTDGAFWNLLQKSTKVEPLEPCSFNLVSLPNVRVICLQLTNLWQNEKLQRSTATKKATAHELSLLLFTSLSLPQLACTDCAQQQTVNSNFTAKLLLNQFMDVYSVELM